jgi:AcrR family transcriptional regulator
MASRSLGTAHDRRVDAIAAATVAFAARGYFGTNTTEIAAAAGISQAYLYRLFPNKEALFVAVLDAVKVDIRQHLDATLDALPTAPESVSAEQLRQASDNVDAESVPLSAQTCGGTRR